MQDRSENNPASEVAAEQVMDSLGVSPEVTDEQSVEQKDELPKFAKEKLGMQEKRHKKEMRKMQSQLDEIRAHLGSRPEPMNAPQPNVDPYSSQPNGDLDSAVAKAMEMVEKKKKDAENAQHVQKQYQSLSDDLDNASDKYEDFDDVVKSPNVPFTNAMRDAALLLPNRTDVLYKLGKNPDELKRISQLPSIQQAQEMVKLAMGLMSGGDEKQAPQGVKTMGNIKSNPVSNSSQVNEKTSVSELRKRMKSGAGWK